MCHVKLALHSFAPKSMFYINCLKIIAYWAFSKKLLSKIFENPTDQFIFDYA